MTLDSTTLLTELAAIQRDARTVAADENLALLDGKSERAVLRIVDRLAALMSSIAAPPRADVTSFASMIRASEGDAPPPVDNGMLGTVNQRLNALERRMNEHHERLESLEEDRRYRDLRRAQDDAHEAHDAG